MYCDSKTVFTPRSPNLWTVYFALNLALHILFTILERLYLNNRSSTFSLLCAFFSELHSGYKHDCVRAGLAWQARRSALNFCTSVLARSTYLSRVRAMNSRVYSALYTSDSQSYVKLTVTCTVGGQPKLLAEKVLSRPGTTAFLRHNHTLSLCTIVRYRCIFSTTNKV